MINHTIKYILVYTTKLTKILFANESDILIKKFTLTESLYTSQIIVLWFGNLLMFLFNKQLHF